MKYYSLLLITLFLFGCGSTENEKNVVFQKNVTAIAFDSNGNLVDYVHVLPNTKIDKIEFHAPENGELINVTVLGPDKDPARIRDFAIISSSTIKGQVGKVTVYFENGIVKNVMGNSASWEANAKNPITEKDFYYIIKSIQSSSHKTKGSTKIYYLEN